MLRSFIFFLGCFLMFASVLVPFIVTDAAQRDRFRVFELGLALAVASHGWPSGIL